MEPHTGGFGTLSSPYWERSAPERCRLEILILCHIRFIAQLEVPGASEGAITADMTRVPLHSPHVFSLSLPH